MDAISADQPVPGWVYVLTHPAWESVGMVKIGRTGRDPRTRAAEITSVSGLLAPCTIAWCSPVSDMAAAEKAVHRMLGNRRTSKRRELFRVDAAMAQQVVEAVARSLPSPGLPLAALTHAQPARRPKAPGRCRAPRRFGPARHGRQRLLVSGRLLVGLLTLATLIVLHNLH